ncbi:MAG: hypothetical protein KF889_24515 [Alphaproteobacteria bacterium]|nr:hypothetical protein [Alphaproteobacteria bacterium]MCW5742623.1 hypothetical protein [Alphaproteobacteria bacterium]
MATVAIKDVPAARLFPLFLVCLASIAYEISLTRFFAIASWSEYGYWVISMTMAGLAASGVVASLFSRLLVRSLPILLPALPILMLLAASLGWVWVTIVPFNPLELQNKQLWYDQLLNIAQYYAAIFPFFFMVGLYVSAYFVLYNYRIGRVYAFDLAGAGLGAALLLALMFVVHPFWLVPCLLPVLALAAWLEISPLWPRGRVRLAALAALAVSLAATALLGQPRINEYKEVFAPMNTQGARVLATVTSPKGLYQLLDNFTERLDTDISNNPDVMAGATMPRAYGLYSDGNRLAALPRTSEVDTRYFVAALDSLPYRLRPPEKTLLLGAAGGFRIHEALRAGARRIVTLEPDAALRGALERGIGPAPPFPVDERVIIRDTSPLATRVVARDGPFDVIDVTREFLAQSDTNRAALSVEVLGDYVGMLGPGGTVSIPVSIREFTVYAVKMFATARGALRRAGIAEPDRHIVIYRSAWNVRILLSATPWTADAIAAVEIFCDERSFDVVFPPAREGVKRTIFNELPVVSFDVTRAQPAGSDPLSEEAGAAVAGQASPYHAFFKLTPPSLDRPYFNAVLPLTEVSTILDRIELVPREELVYLINLAVLAQALVIAALVLLMPLLTRRGDALPIGRFAKSAVYFAGLGLGFLTLEIYLIEKASQYLHDRVFAFGLVLAMMLVCSGAGSLLAERVRARPRTWLGIAVMTVLVWCEVAFVWLDPLLIATATEPMAVRIAILVAIALPVSVALGMPMALGLSQFYGNRLAFLPWAWAVNGACSIISTPLANLLAISIGLKALLLLGAFLYSVVVFTLPADRIPAR